MLAVVAVALSGCGKTEIDAGKAEALVRENLRGPAPESIICPEGVEADKGQTFECEVLYSGSASARVTIHIEDDDGRIRVGPGDFEATP